MLSTILNVNAISPDNHGPVTYSLSSLGGDVAAINTTSGRLTLVAAPSVAGVVALTITATDRRVECEIVNAKGIATITPGGCTTTFALQLEFVSFVSCPSDINEYLDPAGTSARLSWTRPVLPSINSAVVVTSSLGAWQDSYSFNVGTYKITYTTPNLDIGGAVTCAFTIRVQYGFALTVTSIGHIAGQTSLLDFMVDDEGISNGGSLVPAFSGEIISKGISVGVLSPPKRPFSLLLRPNFKAQMHVEQWCVSGSFPTTLTVSNFVASAASINVVGLASKSPLTFTDMGSGYLTDGRCFRILASSSVVTENLAFVSVNIVFNNKGGSRRRATPVNAIYNPVGSNSVLFKYVQVTPSPPLVDLGAMLTLEDKVAPQWLNCPTLPIHVVVPLGNDSAVATWEIPDPVDNVAVLSSFSTAEPGSLFSIVGSPHTVTYTARDSNQAGYCSFLVYVDFSPVTKTITDTVGETFTSSVTSRSLLDLTAATHFLSGGAKTVNPSFTTDFGAFTEAVFRFEAEYGDALAMRTQAEALYAQIEFDLTWRAAAIPEATQVLPLSTDVKATFEFENFALDTTASTQEGESLQQENVMNSPEIILDPSAGTLQIKGQSAVFHRGFTFTSLSIRLQYPKSRASTGPLLFQQVSGSSIGFRYMYAGQRTDTAAMTGFLTILDTERPVFETCPRNISVDADAGKATKAVTWTVPKASDNRGPPTVTTTFLPGATYAVRAFADPGYRVAYTAKDAYGNIATCVFYVRVLDSEAPKLTCPSTRTYTLLPGAKTFAVPETALKPTAITNNVPSANAVTFAPSVLTFGVGTRTVVVSVRDDWQNANTCSVSVRVIDKEAPKVTCPTTNPVPEEGTTGKAVVKWGSIQTADNDRVVHINSTFVTGTYFPVGFTTVLVSVFDASMNSATCNFTVEVVATPKTQGSSGNQNTVITGGGSAGALVVLIAVFALVMYRARQATRKPQRWDDIFALMAQFKEENVEACVPREINRGALRIVSELGKGAFGLVSKGILQESPSIPGFLVAVKSLIPNSTASDRQELLEEAAVMAQFHSPFVVQLIGVITIGKPLLVVVEYMEMGDLKGYLEKNAIDDETKVMFAGDVAEGLFHIHSKGFLHRDIAARNVLVSSERRCKISDFGLAREQEEDTYYRSKGGNLPVRWSAPEALEERKFNEATEIWSFGVVMYEIRLRAGTTRRCGSKCLEDTGCRAPKGAKRRFTIG